LYASPMHATYPAHLILDLVITLIIFVKSTNHGAPHNAIFYNLLSLNPLWSKYSHLHPVLKHP
jgi:hypothetical protein